MFLNINRIRNENRKNRWKEFKDHCLENLNNCEFVRRAMGMFRGCLPSNNGRSWSRLKARKLLGVCRSFETNEFKDFQGIGLG